MNIPIAHNAVHLEKAVTYSKLPSHNMDASNFVYKHIIYAPCMTIGISDSSFMQSIAYLVLKESSTKLVGSRMKMVAKNCWHIVAP